MAAHLMLKGYEVALYDPFPEVLTPIIESGGIELTGEINDFASIQMVSTDIEKCLKNKD